MVRLHEKADNNNIVSKRFSNGKRKFDFSKPLKVWVKDGQTDHIDTLKDTIFFARIKVINEVDDGIDCISLSRLNFSLTDEIQIK